MGNSDYRAVMTTTVRDFSTFLGTGSGITEKRYPIGHPVDDELREVVATFWFGDSGATLSTADPIGYVEMEVIQVGDQGERVVAQLTRRLNLELDQTFNFDIKAGQIEYLKPLYLVVKGNRSPSSTSPTYTAMWEAVDSLIVSLAFDGQNPKMTNMMTNVTGQGDS